MTPQTKSQSSKYGSAVSRKKLLLSVIGLIALGGLCGYLFKDIIIRAGTWSVEHFGLEGIALATLLIDSCPVPMTSEPLILLALGANINWINLALLMSLASHLACIIGHTGGKALRKYPNLVGQIENLFPDIFIFMRENGVHGVLLGALLPIPYAITTWLAGLNSVPFWPVFFASSGRWFKNFVTVALIAWGWNLSSS